MLHAAGFSDVEVFYVFNDFRSPKFIVSRAEAGVVSHYLETVRQGGSPRSRRGLRAMSVADTMRLTRRLSPMFVVKASRT